jgi:hypothetical protein
MRIARRTVLIAIIAAFAMLIGSCSSVFDAGGSTSGSRALEFRWDWDNDGTWDTDWSSESTASRRFASGDTIVVALEVRDGTGTDTATGSFTLDTRHGEIVRSVALPTGYNVYGLTNDGTDFWFTRWISNICKADGVTGAIIDSITGQTNWTGGIDWDGTHLWVNDGTIIHERDPDTGADLSSFQAVYTAGPGGLAWDGTKLYVGSDMTGRDGDGLIHTYTTDGTETGSFPTPRGHLHPHGLAYDGQDLWVAVQDPDTLYVVDSDDGTVLRTVYAQGAGPFMTIKDDYLWATTHPGSGVTLSKIVP